MSSIDPNSFSPINLPQNLPNLPRNETEMNPQKMLDMQTKFYKVSQKVQENTGKIAEQNQAQQSHQRY